MTDEVQNNDQLIEEDEIDILDMLKRLWNERILFAKALGIAFVVAVVVALSIPNEYTTEVKLAPETGGGGTSSSLSSIAALAGVSLGSSSSNGLSTNIYPDVLASTPFLTSLFNVNVQSEDGSINTTLYDYLMEHQRYPWWSSIMRGLRAAPRLIMSLFSSDDDLEEKELDPFNLTRQERAAVGALQSSIEFSTEKSSGIMSLQVTMQDPLISAQMTDTILSSLQGYITAYITNKANQDLEFTQHLYEEAKGEYTKAQRAYAEFTDANQSIFLQKYKAEQQRLQNEMNLAYQTYSSVSQQLQVARAKVQEITPAYTVVQPSVVPINHSSPRRTLIVLALLFVTFCGVAAWVLYGRDWLAELLSTLKTAQTEQ